jgi:hypothetical protein
MTLEEMATEGGRNQQTLVFNTDQTVQTARPRGKPGRIGRESGAQ